MNREQIAELLAQKMYGRPLDVLSPVERRQILATAAVRSDNTSDRAALAKALTLLEHTLNPTTKATPFQVVGLLASICIVLAKRELDRMP